MNTRADTVARVRHLVDMLEDTRQFYESAAQRSSGTRHQRHREKARAYTEMLHDIRRWESRTRQAREGSDTSAVGHGHHVDASESYAALLHRISRMHHAIALVKFSAQTRTADHQRRHAEGYT